MADEFNHSNPLLPDLLDASESTILIDTTVGTRGAGVGVPVDVVLEEADVTLVVALVVTVVVAVVIAVVSLVVADVVVVAKTSSIQVSLSVGTPLHMVLRVVRHTSTMAQSNVCGLT